MKIIAKLVMLLSVLVIYSPVQAEIVVYEKKLKCWAAEEGLEWTGARDSGKGFLVLEVTYDEDGNIEEVVDAYQVEYGRNNNGDKVYTEVQHDFDVVRVVDGNHVRWILAELDPGDGEGGMIMVKGDVKRARVQSRGINEVARKLEGNHLAYWPGLGEMRMCEWTLKWHERWTRRYNREEFDIFDALADIEDWLETRGYNSEV